MPIAKSQKPAIWVIPSWYPPNGGEFFRGHSQGLAAGGAAVTVLAGPNTSIRDFPFTTPWSAFSTRHTTTDGLQEIVRRYWNIPLLDRPNALGWIHMMVSFAERQIRKQGTPQLLQVHSSLWGGVVAARLQRRHGIPYVITEHRSRFVYNSPEARALFLPWHDELLHEAFAGASRIITVSPSLNSRILHYVPEKKQQILSIPNMVDTDFFTPSPTRAAGSNRTFTFFSLAHHIRLKGLDTLLEAFALAAQKEQNIRLIIGGHGPETPALKQQCSQLGINDQVAFAGALSAIQVREQMQQADAFVLPSRFEAFGVVFIEALACGIPVIAARAGGPESFITPTTGLLTEPDRPGQLAEAMLAMRENHHLYHAGHIRQYAIDAFGPQAVAAKYLEVYQQILKTTST